MKIDVTREMMIAHLLLNGFEPAWHMRLNDFMLVSYERHTAWRLTVIGKGTYFTSAWAHPDGSVWQAANWEDLDSRLIPRAYERTLEKDDG
jgi:hypothetical protein